MSTGGENEHSQKHALPSEHEHQDHASAQQAGEQAPDRDRTTRSERPEWVEDVPRDEQGDSSGEEPIGTVDRSGDGDGSDVAEEVVESELVDEADRLIPIILARLDQHQHLHLPMQLPDADALAELKQKDPKAHKVWLKQVGKQMNHDRFMESARYKMPLKVIRSSQAAALTALLFVLALAAYALYLDRPWIAGVLSILDVIGIVGIFTDIGRKSDDD